MVRTVALRMQFQTPWFLGWHQCIGTHMVLSSVWSHPLLGFTYNSLHLVPHSAARCSPMTTAEELRREREAPQTFFTLSPLSQKHLLHLLQYSSSFFSLQLLSQ